MASEPNAWVADNLLPTTRGAWPVRDVGELLAPFAAKYDREGTYPEEAMWGLAELTLRSPVRLWCFPMST